MNRCRVAVILSALMGSVALAAPQQPAASLPLPSSSLPITLIGISFNETTPADSVSMIRCAELSAEVSIYKSGQRACNVADVTEIQQDGVVIKNILSGRLELLKIRNGARDTSAPAPVVTEMPTPPTVRPSADRVDVALPKASLDRYLLNAAELLASALATPHLTVSSDGRPVVDGFELQQIKRGSVIEQIGLRNGDVLTEANGETLDSLPTVMRVFAQAQTATEATLTVMRAGKKLTFAFTVK